MGIFNFEHIDQLQQYLNEYLQGDENALIQYNQLLRQLKSNGQIIELEEFVNNQKNELMMIKQALQQYLKQTDELIAAWDKVLFDESNMPDINQLQTLLKLNKILKELQ